MKRIKNSTNNEAKSEGSDMVERIWEESWTYIKTVVDIVREPVLILDKDLCVMAANESFYRIFQVEPKETEGNVVYKLGNGQWNIPSLRKLLEDILPKNTFFKGFEVSHDFPIIGRKIMILNARQIHSKFNKIDNVIEVFPSIILLAMEDVTEMMVVAETLATHANQIASKLTTETLDLKLDIKKLEKEISDLKRKL